MAGCSSHVVLAYEDAYTYLHHPAVIIGGLFVLEQKWIVSIVFMVPVYATESVISLWNPRFSLACDILRSCYEAFALYSFGRYLIACIGGETRVIQLLENESRKRLGKLLLERGEGGGEEGEEEKEEEIHQKSFCNFFFRPYLLGEDLLTVEKFGLVQYMILKTLCAFLALLLEVLGVYGDGEFKWYYGYPYITVVMNFSQMWALYCLVQFYDATHERLRPIKPLAKFISFKAIVFATWWQGVGIALLCAYGVLPKHGKMQTALQDFFICIEMAIAAVAHVFVFSAEPYHFLPVSENRKGMVSAETTKATLKVEQSNEEKPAMVEKTETQVEAPGTSIKESVQDIVVEGGHRVVEDVVLTINQAIGPMEKGVTKIQETLHRKTEADNHHEESEVEVEEHVEQHLLASESHSELHV
ncbi:protein LAZ1 homolog 2 isoform X2 [Gossypium arboreum]|uniref:protein LAZ1 homolog 2 isoform X2 n=1 Tax=Gossypium arboreum TaxID=29729 RepID=UPI0008194B16|nr:protein LAZ1 homolog 2 isoform X2 [Gossypium arboreum]